LLLQLKSALCSTRERQFEIATDGLTRTKIRPLSGFSGPGAVGTNYVQPGYRSDILIVFPKDGDYCLLNQAAPPDESAKNGLQNGQGPLTVQLLAYVHVRGGHEISSDPEDLETYVEKNLYGGQSAAARRSTQRFA
jgi:hypothetical protein